MLTVLERNELLILFKNAKQIINVTILIVNSFSSTINFFINPIRISWSFISCADYCERRIVNNLEQVKINI